MVNTHLDQIRAEAVKTALSYGLAPDTFSIVWDEGPATAGPKYAIPNEIKAAGTPQHISFWSRTVENSAHPNKPKDVSQLDQFIKDYLHRQSELGYAHLFPTPDADGLSKRYAKIREATLEEAIEFPPEWLQIRVIPPENLLEHVKKSCHELTIKRDETLKEGADYLLTEMKAGTYKPAEVADLLATCAKFRVDSQGVVQKIGSDNEHMPHLLTGALASRIIGKMREGINTKGALQKSIQEITQISKDRHGDFTGWKKYDQSKEKEKAEELNTDLAATNWCTGGDIKSAQNHLSGGNFYVYFEQGDPQIAIRTTKNQVAEIRGRGPGQALTTQTIRKEAENFLTSNKGPTGGENYLWDQNFRRACLKFNNTGEKDDILLTGFDQTGKWIGAEPKAGGYDQDEFEEGYIGKLKQVILPKDKMERTDSDGAIHLFTSYKNREKTPCNLDYTSIAGSLYTNSVTDFHAPNLTHTEGDLCARSATKFHVPKLTHTGGNLNSYSATEFHAPNLTHTGEDLWAKSATEFHAPKLTHTEGGLWANSAKEFHAPNLTHTGGSLWTNSATEFHAPNLTHTGGHLWAKSATEFRSPNLEKIGSNPNHKYGDLEIDAATTVDIPKLSYVKGKITNHPSITLPVALQKEQTKHFISPKGNWQAKAEGNQITLNAAALIPKDVADKIRHELAHVVYSDPTVKSSLEKLHASLPKSTKEKINKIIQKHYPSDQHREEAHARAFEILSKEAPKNLFNQFLQTISDAWNKITNKNAIPKKLERELVGNILQKGIIHLKVKKPKAQELEMV